MRKTILSAVALIALGGAAGAADYRRPVYKAPPAPPPPMLTWNGFYFGANAGYSFGRADNTVFAGTASAVDVSTDVNGWLAGVQAGYNWQPSANWLFGLEADFQITGERASRTVDGGVTRIVLPGGDFNLVSLLAATNSYSLPWFATFRGRLGIVADPSLLLYATGGLAVGEVKYTTRNFVASQIFGPGATGTIPDGPPAIAAGAEFAEHQTRLGWTVGAGAEFKFSQNWSGKLEYLYVDLGRGTYLSGTAGAQTDLRFRDHIARAGINYAFDYAVIAAKY
jgi:outer membrane immunogenic protein